MSIRVQCLVGRLSFYGCLICLAALIILAVQYGNPPPRDGIPNLARTSGRRYASGPTDLQVLEMMSQKGFVSPPDAIEGGSN